MPCSVENCGAEIYCRKLCSKHYRIFLDDARKNKYSVENCSRIGVTAGMCDAHYQRLKRNGNTGTKPILNIPPIINGKCRNCGGEEFYKSNHCVNCIRNNVRNKKYGITTYQYEKMLARQNNVCAICCSLETAQNKKPLSVDHNHSTGNIRGLLCSSCNSGIGFFKDNVIFMSKAIKYLKKYNKTKQ